MSETTAPGLKPIGGADTLAVLQTIVNSVSNAFEKAVAEVGASVTMSMADAQEPERGWGDAVLLDAGSRSLNGITAGGVWA